MQVSAYEKMTRTRTASISDVDKEAQFTLPIYMYCFCTKSNKKLLHHLSYFFKKSLIL